jgi:hypothetical protein
MEESAGHAKYQDNTQRKLTNKPGQSVHSIGTKPMGKGPMSWLVRPFDRNIKSYRKNPDNKIQDGRNSKMIDHSFPLMAQQIAV